MQLPSLQVNFPSGHGLGVVGVVGVVGGGSSTNRHFGVNEISSMAISPEIKKTIEKIEKKIIVFLTFPACF